MALCHSFWLNNIPLYISVLRLLKPRVYCWAAGLFLCLDCSDTTDPPSVTVVDPRQILLPLVICPYSIYGMICFYFYLFIFILQYCIGFAIYQHASTMSVYTCSQSWTPLPPPSPYHPSGSSQCTSPKLPVSCIKPGLAIHFLYDIIYVLMPFSQIIHPLPLPQRPKDCSTHLCLFCRLAYRVIVIIFLNSKYTH